MKALLKILILFAFLNVVFSFTCLPINGGSPITLNKTQLCDDIEQCIAGIDEEGCATSALRDMVLRYIVPIVGGLLAIFSSSTCCICYYKHKKRQSNTVISDNAQENAEQPVSTPVTATTSGESVPKPSFVRPPSYNEATRAEEPKGPPPAYSKQADTNCTV